MRIERLEPRSYVEWDAFVDQHPESTCYHLRAWKEVGERAYGLKAPWLVARRTAEGPIAGVLPLFIVGGALQGHLTNGIFGSYGCTLTSEPGDSETRQALLDEARRIQKERKLTYLMIKSREERDADHGDMQRVDRWVTAELALASDSETQWKSFRDKVRNVIRKGEKHGLTFHHGPGELEDFYDVLSENMLSKGAPNYGIRFMRELAKALGDKAEIITVRDQGHAVAGGLLVFHRDTVSIPFASSRPTALAASPNNYMYWRAIQLAISRGMSTFDFGRSLSGTGPLQFKINMGAVVRTQPTYVLSAPGKSPKFDPNDPVVSFIVKTWKRLPRPLAEALGPIVSRNFVA